MPCRARHITRNKVVHITNAQHSYHDGSAVYITAAPRHRPTRYSLFIIHYSLFIFHQYHIFSKALALFKANSSSTTSWSPCLACWLGRLEENDTQSFSNTLGFATLPAGEGYIYHAQQGCAYHECAAFISRRLCRLYHGGTKAPPYTLFTIHYSLFIIHFSSISHFL